MGLQFSNSDSRLQFSLISKDFVLGNSSEEVLVFERIAGPLLRLVKFRLQNHYQSKFAPEDIVQATFMSFFRRHRRKPYDIENADAMWAIMSKIAMRKCSKEIAKYHRAKRDVKREVHVSNQTTTTRRDYFALADRRQTPNQQAESNENIERILSPLTPEQRRIVVLRLKGFTNKEISKSIGCTERTVYRSLKDLRFHLVGLKSLLTKRGKAKLKSKSKSNSESQSESE